MGVALVVVPERKVEGIGPDRLEIGPALSANTCDGVARTLGVRPLSDFHSQDPQETADFFEEMIGEELSEDLPPEQWFSAADGLTTVRALRTFFETQGAAQASEAILSDLRELEALLGRLADEDVRWHSQYLP